MSLIGKWQIMNDITLECASEIQIDAYANACKIHSCVLHTFDLLAQCVCQQI